MESETIEFSKHAHTKFIYDYNTGEIICSECGEVVGNIVDRGPEWRIFDEEERKRLPRVGSPSTPLIHDKGLSTQIDYSNRDGKKRKLSSQQRAQAYRLRKTQARSISTENKSLIYGLSEIEKRSSVLDLSRSIKETASIVLRKLYNDGLLRGRNLDIMIDSILYFACRNHELPKSFNEFVKKLKTNRKLFAKYYRFICKNCGYPYHPFKKEKLVNKVFEFSIKGKPEEIAIKIIEAAEKYKIASGKSPISIVAASSYIASILNGERMTQRKIANLLDVTEVTVRNRYRELAKNLLFEVYL